MKKIKFRPMVLEDQKIKLKKRPIRGQKYNHSLESSVQDFKHFDAKITINDTLDELVILNKKYKDGLINGERHV